MSRGKKHLDFELNLVPFIDLLSVCICFLLITAVWLNIGSMNVKQAVGGQSSSESKHNPMLWVELGVAGELSIDVKESAKIPSQLRKVTVASLAGRVNLPELAIILEKMKLSEPSLRTALIQPKAKTNYEDIIDLMDQFKKSGLADLGISPL